MGLVSLTVPGDRWGTVVVRWFRLWLERPVALCLGVALALSVVGCPYTTSASLPAHIKTVSIPVFENNTFQVGIEDIVALSLINTFTDDNHLQVTSPRRSDSQVNGSIADYRRVPYSYDSAQNVKEYRVEIYIRVEFLDKKDNSAIWEEERLLGWGVYSTVSGAEGPTSEEAAITQAAERLSEDILNRTISNW